MHKSVQHRVDAQKHRSIEAARFAAVVSIDAGNFPMRERRPNMQSFSESGRNVGAVAQLVERVVRNDEVESSNLFRSTLILQTA